MDLYSGHTGFDTWRVQNEAVKATCRSSEALAVEEHSGSILWPQTHLDSRWTTVFRIFGSLLTTPTRAPLDKLIIPQLLEKFPVFRRSLSFNVVFARARHWTLYREPAHSSTQPTWHFFSVDNSIILPPVPRFLRYLLRLRFMKCVCHVRSTCLMFRPCYSPWLNDYEDIKMKLLLCSFRYSSLSISFLGPHIILITLFKKNTNLYHFLSIRIEVSHSCETTRAILFYKVLSLDSRIVQIFRTGWWKVFPEFNTLWLKK